MNFSTPAGRIRKKEKDGEGGSGEGGACKPRLWMTKGLPPSPDLPSPVTAWHQGSFCCSKYFII